MEKPILFSTEMVKAILAGNKTMTRRVITNLDLIQDWDKNDPTYGPFYMDEYGDYHKTVDRCPYGSPGDLLWVKETHLVHGYWSFSGTIGTGKVKHKFNTHNDCNVWFPDNIPEELDRAEKRTDVGYFKRPSIFMFKKYARIWLKNKSIRVERLQDISEADATAEGVTLAASPLALGEDGTDTYRDAFFRLWNHINADRGYGLATNPWVWVVEFERTEKPQAAKEE